MQSSTHIHDPQGMNLWWSPDLSSNTIIRLTSVFFSEISTVVLRSTVQRGLGCNIQKQVKALTAYATQENVSNVLCHSRKVGQVLWLKHPHPHTHMCVREVHCPPAPVKYTCISTSGSIRQARGAQRASCRGSS